jgi:hypothetical protein
MVRISNTRSKKIQIKYNKNGKLVENMKDFSAFTHTSPDSGLTLANA